VYEILPGDVDQRVIHAAGTTFAVDLRGDGPPLVVIHGAGEDRSMLGPLAKELAARGRQVITYDRRGTGGSGRDDWPGNGADQHADDAAAILDALGIGPVGVLGLSSGGVIALGLAARHPRTVARVLAWEPPTLGVLPGADAINAEIMAPIDQHLVEHPGDFVGAQALLLSFILGYPVTVDDPLFAPARANAEPMVRDDPSIVLRTFTAEELAGLPLTVAVGTAPNEAIAAGVAGLTALTGQAPLTVDTADHEVYLLDPAAFAEVVVEHR
jgi:pimeloyl-ACP methyl ester carboxylesterase